MYAIISKGELLALCERPRYVKRNEETGAYGRRRRPKPSVSPWVARCITCPAAPPSPTRRRRWHRRARLRSMCSATTPASSRTRRATNAAFAAVEEAMCELDSSSEERLTAVEEALCELDGAANGGGEN